MIIAWLIFIGWSSLLSLVLAMFIGQLTVWIAGLSLILAASLAFFFRDQFRFPKRALLQKFFIWSIVALAAFQVLIFEKSQGQIWVSNPNNFGDLSWHLQLIRFFSSGAHFWPENPILIAERIRYPFGMDLFNSLFEIFSIPTELHIGFVQILCLLVLVLLLEQVGGFWLLAAFFFSGGIGGFGPESTLTWKNLYLSVWTTQRGFLYALPVGLYLLEKILFHVQELKRREQIQLFLLAAPLAFFHLHTAFILGLIWLISFFIQKRRRDWLVLLCSIVLFWSPFVINSIWAGSQLATSLHWHWNWTNEDNFILFWFKNFHLWLVLLMFSIWKIRTPMYRGLLALTFLFCNLMLAPWAWDQIKILLWFYLILNIYIYRNIVSKQKIWLQIIFLGVFIPGLYQLISSGPWSTRPTSLVSLKEVELAQSFKEKMLADDRILTAPTFNHPMAFVGSSLVAGYEGHLWSMGYRAEETLKKMNLIVTNHGDGRKIAEELKVRWIYWGSHEKKIWGEPPTWVQTLPLIYGTTEASLYEIRSWH